LGALVGGAWWVIGESRIWAALERVIVEVLDAAAEKVVVRKLWKMFVEMMKNWVCGLTYRNGY
jgi:hypothetical protein